MVHNFVAGYMRQVKDCHLAETASNTVVISCSSSEILNNATSALEQVALLSCNTSLVSGCHHVFVDRLLSLRSR